jgi:hypothetical protein
MSNPSHETVSFLAQKLSKLARLTEKIKLGHLQYDIYGIYDYQVEKIIVGSPL